MTNLKQQVETIKANEAAMVFCEKIADVMKIYGEDSASARNDADFLSMELGKDGIEAHPLAIMNIAKQIARA